MSNEIEKVETTEVVEETKQGFLSKVGNGIKKHGKKILAIAGVAAAAAIGYALGKGSNAVESDNYELDGMVEEDVLEAEFVEAE